MAKKPNTQKRDTRSFADRLDAIINPNQSHERTRDSQSTTANKIRDVTNRMYRDSGLQAFGQQYRGRSTDKITQIQLPSVRMIGNDGEDHINCTNMGSTVLGHSISPQARLPFKHKFAGPFKTLEGFIQYLRNEDDAFRVMSGYAASVAGKNKRARNIGVQGMLPISTELLVLAVADAYWQQITSKPDIVKALVANNLPFDMFHIDKSGIRIRTYNATWMIHALNLISAALKENKDYPNFIELFTKGSHTRQNYAAALLENPKLTQRQYFEGILKKHFSGLVDTQKLQENEAKILKKAEEVAREASKEILSKSMLPVEPTTADFTGQFSVVMPSNSAPEVPAVQTPDLAEEVDIKEEAIPTEEVKSDTTESLPEQPSLDKEEPKEV